MELLSGEEIFEEQLANTLHQPTQVNDHSVSLTASMFYRPRGRGELDFGGSELQLVDRGEIEPEKRDPEDDYGWWELSSGMVLMELNETINLAEGIMGILSPHDHLVWNGASHPTLTLGEEDAQARLVLPLQVGEQGIAVKENARISLLRILRT